MQARYDLIAVYEEIGEEENGAALRQGLQGFYAEPKSHDEIVLKIRELASAGFPDKAREFYLQLSHDPLSDKEKVWICEALLKNRDGEELIRVAEEISSSPFVMNVIYFKIFGSILLGDGIKAIKYLLQAHLRDRSSAIITLFQCSQIAGFEGVELEGMDEICNAALSLCMHGSKEAAPLLSSIADSSQDPYALALTALTLCLNEEFDEAFKYAARAGSSGISELELVLPLIPQIYRVFG